MVAVDPGRESGVLSLSMRNRFPSWDTSYVRPGPGTPTVGQSNNFTAFRILKEDPDSTGTAMSSPLGVT